LQDSGRGSLATRVDNAWPVAELTAGIEARYRLCLTHLHSTPPLGGSRRSIAMPYGTEN